jgi:hypothetical protein
MTIPVMRITVSSVKNLKKNHYLRDKTMKDNDEVIVVGCLVFSEDWKLIGTIDDSKLPLNNKLEG